MLARSPIDQSVLHLICIGDEKAFRLFFDHYRDRFFYVAFKMTGLEDVAEETVQEVFIQIWKQRESITTVKDPDAYFFTVLYRQVYKYYRKTALVKKLRIDLAELPFAKNITDEMVLAKETERIIQEAVSRLPAQQQTVFSLTKQEGLSREEIAAKMKISPNTVRNHLAEAMKTVRTYIGDLLFLCGIFLHT